MRKRRLSDPLTVALQPPLNESITERENRLKAENEAKKVSDNIDEMIRQERADRKKTKPDVHVLLLGQSESGKSTTLKRECISLLACRYVSSWGGCLLSVAIAASRVDWHY